MNYKTFSFCVVAVSFLALLTACSKGSSAGPDLYTANAANADLASTALTQDDLKLLGDADAREASSYQNGAESASSTAGLTAGYTKVFGDIGDLSAPFAGIESCSTTNNAMGSNLLTVNCPGVVGTVTGTMNFGTFSFNQVINLEVTGAQGHALIKHIYNSASMFGLTSSRSIDDTLTANSIQFSMKGLAQFTRAADGNGITIAGTYDVTKNSGVVETLTITSEGLRTGTCGLNSGTVTYTASSGLTHTVTFPACPAPVVPPGMPGMPGFPGPGLPIMIPPIAL